MLTPLEWQALRLSLIVATCAVFFALPPAIAVGYALARWRWRGRALVETVVNLPLVLPPVVTGFLLLVLLGRRGPVGGFLESALGLRVAFTWIAAVIAAAVVSFPLIVRVVRLAFQSVDPRLEKAARSLGVRRAGVFFSISLPLAWRGVLAGGVLGFARSLGEFGATIVVAGSIPGRTQTLPIALYTLIQRPGGLAESWRLVAISIALAAAALIVSEALERRDRLS